MRDPNAGIKSTIPMSRDDFVQAMGGQEQIEKNGGKVIVCECGHECCRGWDVVNA